ncbi:peptidoglycan-binding protein [Streptomyces ferrugineus]|uniref:Peptidoglycan-binding protein n=2 Tax=Streptomyces ferrugineus TaxID=1413221 RepID=A0A7M2SZU4_9ACTN|nr:peptidoglycan-binding protein [Streptomyces ferrugineus]
MCPECGAARAADNTPSCGCRERVSDALRDARTAEAAAAEDFDPLRIRPYVELEGEDAAETMQLRPTAPTSGSAARPSPPSAPALPTPLAATAPSPSTQDLSLFEPDATPDDEAGAARAEEPAGTPRHRRTILLGAGGALVAVITAASLASGMFSYEAPQRHTALPDDLRVSVPALPTSATPESSAATETGTATESASPSASGSPTESPSASPSPSRSRSTASPTPAPTTEPTSAPPSTEASDSQQESAAAREPGPPVLQRGDRGPEVTELELRLTQLGLYTREARGTYNEGVEDAVSRYQWARGIQRDEYGVYDLETRQRLESETTEP